MKRILICGANGQLGNEIRTIADQFKPFQFFFTDVDELDLTSRSSVENYFIENNPIHWIVNCAAYTAVDKAEENFETARMVNAVAVKNLAEVAKQYNSALIHISTDYVFPGTNHRPYTEKDKTAPDGAYGKTKLEGEKYFFDSGVKGVVIRTSWLYSTFGNNFFKTMLRLGKERPELSVIFDQIGTPTYAGDLASAVLHIISEDEKYADKLQSGLYHFSNEGVCSWYDFATEIMNLSGLKSKIKPVLSSEYPLPAPRPFYSVLDKSAIKADFNLSIPHWKESLIECLNKLNK